MFGAILALDQKAIPVVPTLIVPTLGEPFVEPASIRFAPSDTVPPDNRSSPAVLFLCMPVVSLFMVKPAKSGVAPVCISCGVDSVGLPDTPSPLVTVIWLVVPVMVLATVVLRAVLANIPLVPGSAIPPPDPPPVELIIGIAGLVLSIVMLSPAVIADTPPPPVFQPCT